MRSHFLARGVIAGLQGGKFGHGFISAGFTKGVGTTANGMFNNGPISGTIVSAVVGGTASEISGGKFANGANTAVFQSLFNQFGWMRQKHRRDLDEKFGKGTYDKHLENSGDAMLNAATLVVLPGAEVTALVRGSWKLASILGYVNTRISTTKAVFDWKKGNLSDLSAGGNGLNLSLFALSEVYSKSPFPYANKVAIMTSSASNVTNYVLSVAGE